MTAAEWCGEGGGGGRGGGGFGVGLGVGGVSRRVSFNEKQPE